MAASLAAPAVPAGTTRMVHANSTVAGEKHIMSLHAW